MDRSLRFYRDLLGMEVAVDTEMQGEMLDREVALQGAHIRVVELKVGQANAYLELLQYYAPPGKPFPRDFRCCDTGAPHIAFLVPDIQRAYEELSAAGVRFTSPPQDVDSGAFRGSKTVYCYDPDGLIAELWELPA
ncbi:MAG: VOC family protein [Chloroflexi bacterium]|nr:VOC family protein [Chloroflexota bacterium]